MNQSTLSRLLIVSAMVSLFPLRSSADDSVWQDVTVATALSRSGGEPIYYRPLRADDALLKDQLNAAPREFTSSQGTVLSLPMPDGTMQRFDVVESPIMEPGLAQRYPEIHTYHVVGIDDPQISGRLDMTPRGFHAMLSGPGNTVFIDPDAGGSYYRSYFKRDYANAKPRGQGERPVCLVDGSIEPASGTVDQSPALSARTGSQLRTYRLAVAATGEYTAYFGGKTSDALSAIVTAINRVNQVYGRDLAIGFVLVASEDQVIYTNAATDPYTNSNPYSLITENQANVDAVIGTANYDIGHVFSTGGGGLARLGVACGGNKARGTTGLYAPIGDPFYIDYVAHEIGHQMGANHTFNGTTGSCGGSNRHASTAYEPGSGSTVMAYAGICGAEDLQANSDATFHAGSIEEINAYVAAGGACYSGSGTGNSAPTADAGAAYTIPSQTPFVLTGSATDPDGDTLSYQWDEMDAGTTTDSSTIGTDLGDNALFRSFLPKDVAYRDFPRLADQLTGTSNVGETLPTTARTLHFRLTARDGHYGVDEANTSVTVDNGSGPFKVVSPNGGTLTGAPYGTFNVTWNVANTTAAPVSCANVNIEMLAFNSAHTSYCATTLKPNTPNNGSATGVTITVANNAHARIRISCSDNVFYDISDSDITISGAASSEPTNCVTTDGANLEHGTEYVHSDTSLSSGGGGGGSFGPWLLALLGVVSGLRFGISARRSV